MSVILNFNLSFKVTSGISEIICLFDPSPAFQYAKNSIFSYSQVSDANLIRDNTVASAGFNATDIFHPGNPSINLPANSYVVNNPSNVYGTSPSGDTYSVVQINTNLAAIEPGFSRIRISYFYLDSTNNSINTITEYFDCPFYEGFNITARELNNLKDYIKQSQSFLQQELDFLTTQTSYALSHDLWRGTSVSGQLITTPVTFGLSSGGGVGQPGVLANLYTNVSSLSFASPTAPAQNIVIFDNSELNNAYTFTISNSGIINANLSGNTIAISPSSSLTFTSGLAANTTITINDSFNNSCSVVIYIYPPVGTLSLNSTSLTFENPAANEGINRFNQK